LSQFFCILSHWNSTSPLHPQCNILELQMNKQMPTQNIVVVKELCNFKFKLIFLDPIWNQFNYNILWLLTKNLPKKFRCWPISNRISILLTMKHPIHKGIVPNCSQKNYYINFQVLFKIVVFIWKYIYY